MKVVPINDHNEFWSLTPGKHYVVIGMDRESYRVVDDKGEPILFPKSGFQVIDGTIPADWVWDRHAQDEYYADAPEFAGRGFFEDYFDGKPEAVERFVSYLRKKGLIADSESPPRSLECDSNASRPP